MKTNKRHGISLIVLVITIIVMIILAASIILSLNSAGIIGKANQAKDDTFKSNLREAATVSLAEYELAVRTGEIDENDMSAEEYVKGKLSGQFTDDELEQLVITDIGKVIIGAAAELISKNVPVGTPINYGDFLTEKTYTTTGTENRGNAQTLTTNTDLTWVYAGINADGKAIIVADIPSELPSGLEMTIYGVNGIKNGPTQINDAAAKLYTTNKGIGRAMTKADIERINDNNILKVYYTYSGLADNIANDSIATDTLDRKSYYLNNYSQKELSPEPDVFSHIFYSTYYYDSSDGLVREHSLTNGLEQNGVSCILWLPFRPVVELNETVNLSYSNGTITIAQ